MKTFQIIITLICMVFLSFETNAESNPLPAGYLSCPPISALHKNTQDMTWSANNGWMSYSTSFVSHLDKFLGAQWQGVNVGNLNCIYASNDPLTFPVILTYNLLVYQPTSGKWTRDLGGYANCLSPTQEECVFKPQKLATEGDVYQEAADLKTGP